MAPAPPAPPPPSGHELREAEEEMEATASVSPFRVASCPFIKVFFWEGFPFRVNPPKKDAHYFFPVATGHLSFANLQH